MRTNEIMQIQLTGKYYVQIKQENHSPHNDGIEFENLFEAIKYVNGLTFSACKNELNLTDNDVRGKGGFSVDVLMHEDTWGTNCKTEDGLYPILYSEMIND